MERHSHAAFTVTDLVTDKRLVIVAGGFHNESSINSTEVLMGNQWINGMV